MVTYSVWQRRYQALAKDVRDHIAALDRMHGALALSLNVRDSRDVLRAAVKNPDDKSDLARPQAASQSPESSSGVSL